MLPESIEGTGNLRAKIRCFLVFEPLNPRFYARPTVNEFVTIFPPQFVLISKGKYDPNAERDFGNDATQGGLDYGRLRGNIEAVIDVGKMLESFPPEQQPYIHIVEDFEDIDGSLQNLTDDVDELKDLLLLLISEDTKNLSNLVDVNDLDDLKKEVGLENLKLPALVGSSALGGEFTCGALVFTEWIGR